MQVQGIVRKVSAYVSAYEVWKERTNLPTKKEEQAAKKVAKKLDGSYVLYVGYQADVAIPYVGYQAAIDSLRLCKAPTCCTWVTVQPWQLLTSV